MSGDDLEAGHGLENVSMGIGEYRLLSGMVPPGTQVVVDRHALQRAGGSIVESIVLDLFVRRADTPRDGRTVFYTQSDPQSVIKMVENFR